MSEYLGNIHPRSVIRKALYESLVQANLTGVGDKVFIGRHYGFDRADLPIVVIDMLDGTAELKVANQANNLYLRDVSAKVQMTVSAASELEAIDKCEVLAREIEEEIASPGSLIDSFSEVPLVSLTSFSMDIENAGKPMVTINLVFSISYNDQFLQLN